MTSRSRRQTRRRRTDGWAPEWHNEAVKRRKAYIRDSKEHEARRRARARMFDRHFAAVDRHEQERQRQIAQADLMATLGWDMRDEHDALERGELVE